MRTPHPSARPSTPGSNASIYTAEAVRLVMARAEARFVDVVMEVDTPAHTLAIGKAHPEMLARCWEWMATSRYKATRTLPRPPAASARRGRRAVGEGEGPLGRQQAPAAARALLALLAAATRSPRRLPPLL